MKIFTELKYWNQYRKFLALPKAQRAIVFYCEGKNYWVHLEPIIDYLLANSRQAICFISSDPNDPGLSINKPQYNSFVIGEGHVRTTFFAALNTKILVMTMPDLNLFHIRRSPQTQYVAYIHHSIVSCHMAYRKGAFDHFDAIFCAGPHHENEIRAIEKHQGLKPKQLIKHGYGRLDAILAKSKYTHSKTLAAKPYRILLAPSWGEQAVLETIGNEVIDILLAAAFHVTVRPHPQTYKLHPQRLAQIKQQYTRHDNFLLEEGISSQTALHQSHVMISDWSGAAFDYAFGLEKPVLFIDVTKKINNPEYTSLNTPVLEETIRSQIGKVVATNQLQAIPDMLHELINNKTDFHTKILQARKQWVFNISKSGKMGALALLDICEQLA